MNNEETIKQPELTDKEQLFVEYYLQCWDASKAARLAGYKDPGQSGYENKKKQEIQEAIKSRIKEVAMSADEVLLRLADQARSSMADFLSVSLETETEEETTISDTGVISKTIRRIRRQSARLDIKKAAKLGKLHLIKRYNKTDKGISIELYDNQAALQLLGKHLGLFIERHQVTQDISYKVYERTDDFDPDSA